MTFFAMQLQLTDNLPLWRWRHNRDGRRHVIIIVAARHKGRTELRVAGIASHAAKLKDNRKC